MGDSDQSVMRVNLVKPAAVDHYQISKEQLDMLRELRRDGLFEVAFAAVGAAVGSIPGTVQAINEAYLAATPVPLTMWGLANIVITFVGIAVASLCFIVSGRRGKRADDLIQKIMNPNAKPG